jgi:hypothetical protein
MPHTRASVIKRTIKEFQLLDKQVARLKPADWKRPLPRPETKDPWTVKDALAHITHWKANTIRVIRKLPPPPEAKLDITKGNRVIFKRWHRRTPGEILAWHRQVQKDLLKALREAPAEWFTAKHRGPDWPYDLDGHSADHRLKDIARALEK